MQSACAILSSVPFPAQQYFSTLVYLINGTIFEKKKYIEHKCVFLFSLQLLSENFLILRRTEPDVIENIYIGLHLKCPLFLSDFNEI